MEITTLGIDLAKSAFQLHGVDDRGTVVVQKKLRRRAVLDFLSKLDPCLIGMEACPTSHFWAREIAALGHDVRLIPPAYVKPYRIGQGRLDRLRELLLGGDRRKCELLAHVCSLHGDVSRPDSLDPRQNPFLPSEVWPAFDRLLFPGSVTGIGSLDVLCEPAGRLCAHLIRHLADGIAHVFALKLLGSKLDTHCLVAGVDAALMQQILRVAEREREPDIKHHRQADDLGLVLKYLKGLLVIPGR